MSYDEINVDIWSLQPEEVITIQNVGSKKCDQSKFYVYYLKVYATEFIFCLEILKYNGHFTFYIEFVCFIIGIV